MEASQAAPVTPTEPEAQAPATTDDILRAILAEQQQYRQQISELQTQINATKTPAPVALANAPSPEEALKTRMLDVSQHDYYCPACGALYDYRQQCNGTGDQPHSATEVVSTDELKSGDATKHTAAPVPTP